MSDGPTFQWLGTAGFRIEFGGRVLLIDPFLDSRGPDARPEQPLKAGDFAGADEVFITHGHFDHLADVPAIVEESGARVYCSQVAAETLLRKNVPPGNITRLGGDESLDIDGLGVNVFPSRHIVFDRRLILRTAPRVLKLRNRHLLGRMSGMPSGPALIYWFDFGGLSVVHMGSLGLTPEQATYQRISGPDILMPPLQGHSDICTRAALLSAAIRPRAVVPQHFDDFFPPVSMAVGLLPFKRMLEDRAPGCAYYEPVINRVFTADDVLGGTENGTGSDPLA
jgi:L-ascorbate metabolism protein UlaG (beta-lactamase superfamily)